MGKSSAAVCKEEKTANRRGSFDGKVKPAKHSFDKYEAGDMGWAEHIPSCPVFYPSKEEFEDPLAYIRSIASTASKFGICKIKSPITALVTAGSVLMKEKLGLKFTTRVQPMRLANWDTKDKISFLRSGRNYSFNEYEKMANKFFCRRFMSMANLPPNFVELEFWREMVSDKALNVEYGCDIEGSAFSSLMNDPLGSSKWNLKDLACLPNSTLRLLRIPIPGVTEPMLYLGMLFSMFAWHVEDHYLYSINYHHCGALKTWYGVPGHAALNFEKVVQECVYDHMLLEEGAGAAYDLLMGKTTMFPPNILVDKGVPVYKAVQYPGEFVITFPQAYHSGFSHGFNCGEAVNFAMPDWLPFGTAACKRYMLLKRMPLLPHEELLCKEAMELANIDSNSIAGRSDEGPRGLDAQNSVKVAFVHFMRFQHKVRWLLEQLGAQMSVSMQFERSVSCSMCKHMCYTNFVTCPCVADPICLNHAQEIGNCGCGGARSVVSRKDWLDLEAVASRFERINRVNEDLNNETSAKDAYTMDSSVFEESIVNGVDYNSYGSVEKHKGSKVDFMISPSRNFSSISSLCSISGNKSIKTSPTLAASFLSCDVETDLCQEQSLRCDFEPNKMPYSKSGHDTSPFNMETPNSCKLDELPHVNLSQKRKQSDSSLKSVPAENQPNFNRYCTVEKSLEKVQIGSVVTPGGENCEYNEKRQHKICEKSIICESSSAVMCDENMVIKQLVGKQNQDANLSKGLQDIASHKRTSLYQTDEGEYVLLLEDIMKELHLKGCPSKVLRHWTRKAKKLDFKLETLVAEVRISTKNDQNQQLALSYKSCLNIKSVLSERKALRLQGLLERTFGRLKISNIKPSFKESGCKVQAHNIPKKRSYSVSHQLIEENGSGRQLTWEKKRPKILKLERLESQGSHTLNKNCWDSHDYVKCSDVLDNSRQAGSHREYQHQYRAAQSQSSSSGMKAYVPTSPSTMEICSGTGLSRECTSSNLDVHGGCLIEKGRKFSGGIQGTISMVWDQGTKACKQGPEVVGMFEKGSHESEGEIPGRQEKDGTKGTDTLGPSQDKYNKKKRRKKISNDCIYKFFFDEGTPKNHKRDPDVIEVFPERRASVVGLEILKKDKDASVSEGSEKGGEGRPTKRSDNESILPGPKGFPRIIRLKIKGPSSQYSRPDSAALMSLPGCGLLKNTLSMATENRSKSSMTFAAPSEKIWEYARAPSNADINRQKEVNHHTYIETGKASSQLSVIKQDCCASGLEQKTPLHIRKHRKGETKKLRRLQSLTSSFMTQKIFGCHDSEMQNMKPSGKDSSGEEKGTGGLEQGGKSFYTSTKIIGRTRKDSKIQLQEYPLSKPQDLATTKGSGSAAMWHGKCNFEKAVSSNLQEMSVGSLSDGDCGTDNKSIGVNITRTSHVSLKKNLSHNAGDAERNTFCVKRKNSVDATRSSSLQGHDDSFPKEQLFGSLEQLSCSNNCHDNNSSKQFPEMGLQSGQKGKVCTSNKGIVSLNKVLNDQVCKLKFSSTQLQPQLHVGNQEPVRELPEPFIHLMGTGKFGNVTSSCGGIHSLSVTSLTSAKKSFNLVETVKKSECMKGCHLNIKNPRDFGKTSGFATTGTVMNSQTNQSAAIGRKWLNPEQEKRSDMEMNVLNMLELMSGHLQVETVCPTARSRKSSSLTGYSFSHENSSGNQFRDIRSNQRCAHFTCDESKACGNSPDSINLSHLSEDLKCAPPLFPASIVVTRMQKCLDNNPWGTNNWPCTERKRVKEMKDMWHIVLGSLNAWVGDDLKLSDSILGREGSHADPQLLEIPCTLSSGQSNQFFSGGLVAFGVGPQQLRPSILGPGYRQLSAVDSLIVKQAVGWPHNCLKVKAGSNDLRDYNGQELMHAGIVRSKIWQMKPSGVVGSHNNWLPFPDVSSNNIKNMLIFSTISQEQQLLSDSSLNLGTAIGYGLSNNINRSTQGKSPVTSSNLMEMRSNLLVPVWLQFFSGTAWSMPFGWHV